MTPERDPDIYLLHQVAAPELAADIASGLASTALIWRHRNRAGLVVGFAPSVLASALVIRRDLSRLRTTRRGRHVLAHMPPSAQAIRLMGQLIVWCAACRRRPSSVIAGIVVIVSSWSHGLLQENR